MTNLFLHDSRTIAMDNEQQMNSDFGSSNNSRILMNLKPVFFEHFEQAVEDCCVRIDIEFGRQLGKKREKMDREQYIKLLEYLRSVRKEIKQNYLSKINAMFDSCFQKTVTHQSGQLDFSKISLISDDAVKENHAITQIIRQCEKSLYDELTDLNRQLAIKQGKKAVADNQNPIFPEQLVRVLVEIVKPLKLNADGRIALYKAFEANVFNQLGIIYGELTVRCTAMNPVALYVVGEIKEEVKPVSDSAEQPDEEFVLLQKKLEQLRWARFPSAYDSIPVSGDAFYQRFEIANALQLLQQFNDADPGEKKQPLKWRVLKKLEELSFGAKLKNLARHDEDVLDLAALIFAEIERDESIHDAVKTAVLPLEIPFSLASLGRYSVFTSQDNPVRQLLDSLLAAGMFLNADEYDFQPTQVRIACTVESLTWDSGPVLAGWQAAAGEFLIYLDKQKQRALNLEDSLRQLMISQQAMAASRKAVAQAIEDSMQDKVLPAAIVDFLRNVWSEVLLAAYIDKDERPEQWGKSIQAMDELIVSVMPPANDDERKRILKLLPGLIAELRKGLKQIAYDKSAQSRFFKELAVWHIILMDKKEAKKTADGTGKANTVPVQDGKIKMPAIAGDYLEQAENLAEQSWVAFALESGRQWGKLLWKDAENMLFVGKSGAKIAEIKLVELAEKLQLGQAFIVNTNDKAITERVLSELMNL
jgi:hypothetical protein